MRTKNSILNISTNIVITVMKTFMTFIVRTIFIKILGQTYLGVNGLLTNVLSMLSLAELGIGTAINFSLYKPLAENDNIKISKLMTFYKKSYRIIAFIVCIIGIILFFFLDVIIKDADNIQNLNIIYFLFLANTVFTYLISYKETLITADQKAYKLTKINFIFTILVNVGQVIVLLITKNFIFYLLAQLLISYIQKVFINRYITKQYKEINFNCKEKLDKKDLNQIITNVKAMFFHKIGDYCINGTDNIIISSFIGINTVGIYSNYLTIINMFNTFINLIYNGMTASLGNLIVTENREKQYGVFRQIDFIGFLIYSTCTIGLLNLINPFIMLWIGNEYVLSMSIVIAIVVNFFITGMRIPVATIKNAAGLYHQDRFTPIMQSIINLIFSIILVKWIGLLGVVLGTIISGIAIPCWQRPYIIYRYIFKRNVREYAFIYAKYIVVLLFSSAITAILFKIFSFETTIITFLLMGILCLLVHFSVVWIFYRKDPEMKYTLDLRKNIMKKGVEKIWKRA